MRGTSKHAERVERLDVARLVLRPLGDEHFGQRLADARALDRVVVDEDDRLQTEVQLLHEVGDVLRLVAPVDAPAGEVLLLDDHLGVDCDRFERDGLFVLADDGERDAALRERQDRALEIDERFADGIVAAESKVLPA